VYIYKITHAGDGKAYIGMDTRPVALLSRWKEHQKIAKRSPCLTPRTLLYSAMRKYTALHILMDTI